ncbi:membrane integrity-associated transporter subunit PqiC [Hafnia sp. HMSC23F03]|uniref:membrane integrity-associated transporter subunit PqiC n=1 Tax=Hafnia sp. HMSC23F03 TaxID=1581059 RepID=UPI0008A1AD03|nr:membrane integrity-associated transporter subunit PqiC [Hafnia sp. HMSC23F03]OFS08986.1 hypothetical protein HMPREF3091_16260 [Hafnia sp. HMSC23F03]
MKVWMIGAAALLLSACSSQPQKNYYQLPVPTATTSVVHAPVESGAHQLWLERVNVADFLSALGVVYQTNDVQFVTAGNNLWASPLEQQLQQTMVANLSAAMPGWIVSAQPLGNVQDTLNINVTGFHGRYDGKAVISGEWILMRNGQLTKRAFNLVLPVQQDGYDALVKTLAQGWQQEAQQIARQVQ